ncbi:MAG: class I SAM-dependent methyltransferase [Chloroflexi bacterium]|nr:class I SAM-dependent methyltransferase [Chloroflexota bacterium]
MLRRLHFNFMYFGRPPWDSGISPPELLEFITKHPAGRAIDIGCGTGTNVLTLAQNGWQVTGIDFAPRAIQIAKRKTKNVKINLEVNDATTLKGINGPFDLALDLGCFHGIEKKADYLTQLDRVLAPGGFWLMYGFFKSDPHLSGPGLAAPDLDLIQARGFRLLTRKDGWDKRERPSAWFLFEKPHSR